ncbi:MAG: response regulator [Methanomicrobiaceae archaeon]|nr:response regulator [Methanomicrobiaceae archaeon]
MTAKRIMVVEDDVIIASLIENRLKKLGYEVCGICDAGEDAIVNAAEHRPDLVLMDIRLRGAIDGIDAAGEIRSDIGIPCIFLTSYSDRDTIERAKAIRPEGFILKPFTDDALRSAIEIAFSHRE